MNDQCCDRGVGHMDGGILATQAMGLGKLALFSFGGQIYIYIYIYRLLFCWVALGCRCCYSRDAASTSLLKQERGETSCSDFNPLTRISQNEVPSYCRTNMGQIQAGDMGVPPKGSMSAESQHPANKKLVPWRPANHDSAPFNLI